LGTVKRKTLSNSDEDLLTLYVHTNSSGYIGELYNRYIPLIYGLFLKYLHNAERAEEATLELFKILLPKISCYEIKDFKTWIYSVAKNHCLQILKKEKKHISTDFDFSVEEPDHILHLLENGSKYEKEILNRCIEKLPKQQRITISMFFKDKMSYADIAEQTGYLLKTVKSQIQNGRKNLKTSIEKLQNG